MGMAGTGFLNTNEALMESASPEEDNKEPKSIRDRLKLFMATPITPVETLEAYPNDMKTKMELLIMKIQVSSLL